MASHEPPLLAAAAEDDDPRPLVLLLGPPVGHYEALSHSFRFLKPWESHLPRDDFLAAHAPSVRAALSTLLAPLDAHTIARLPQLACVVTTSAGVDHIDLAECRRRGIVVGNCGTVFSESAAEYAVGLLLDALRRISAADRYVRKGMWKVRGVHPLTSKLSGRRVGIIGLGSIGSLIARMLGGFNCVVSYTSRKKKPSVPYEYFPTAIELASQNDALIVSCSLTEETRHIVGREVLEALGKHGVVVNIGRGALVDEMELIRCLREGVIAGAGLDVFEDEPHVPSELLEMDNVVLSPHIAVVTEQSVADLMKITAGNLEAFFSGKPLLRPVPL